MTIKFQIDATLSQYTNNHRLSKVNGNTVGDCLNHLAEQFPGLKTVIFDNDGKLNSSIAVFMNGKFPRIEHLLRPVKDGDELTILLLSEG